MASESKSAVGVLDPHSAGRRSRLPERKPVVSETINPQVAPRALVGATVLQVVPALRENPVARTAIDAARALLQVGARALIAGEAGPLVNEATAAGAEWVALSADTVNPFRLRRNARTIEQLIGLERVDIVHAHSASAAWSARAATERSAAFLAVSLPDQPVNGGFEAYYTGSLPSADRIIAPSAYAASPLMQRHGVSPEQITVVPRSIDT